MGTYEYILISLSVGQLLAMVVGFYKFFSKPAERANDRIALIEQACPIRHRRIDEVMEEMRKRFESIDERLLLIKENDIKHIENEMRRMSETQVKILTILEYKDGKNLA